MFELPSKKDKGKEKLIITKEYTASKIEKSKFRKLKVAS